MGAHFVQQILAQTGDAVMQSCHLPTRFLTILGTLNTTVQPFVGLTELVERRFKECLVLVSLCGT
ncbi:hypothetical protein KDK_68650 [Dictyobacter kobayashii]|uniref:Uncharacterized protein n=1 Tax=Dictyobacter kobayashii TaxID=2014872 RepID=A0A402AVG5_9CHLR|nr:hypothetical protein KDK_68650 [Dictyobacter kobayashii]